MDFYSAPAAVPDTPHRKRDSSHLDNDGVDSSMSTHHDLDADLFAEIQAHIYINLPQFTNTFMCRSPAVDDDVLDCLYTTAIAQKHYDPVARRWRDFPHLVPSEARVVTWFTNVVNPLLRTAALPGTPFFPFSPAPPSKTCASFGGGSGVKRRVELVVSGITTADTAATIHNWRHVRTFLELKQSAREDTTKRIIVQIAGYAREMLYAQPTRRAAHGMTLCSTGLRCWFMDRMGLLASPLIDINNQPLAFLRAMLFYATADAERLGFDPTVTTASLVDGCWTNSLAIYDPTLIPIAELGRTGLPSIQVPKEEEAVPEPDVDPEPGPNHGRVCLLLAPEPVFATAALLSRGSVCWAARRIDQSESVDHTEWPLAVKTQWRDEAREPEGLLLRRMCGTRGVAQYVCHEDVSSPNGGIMDVCGAVRNHIHLAPQYRKVLRRRGDEEDDNYTKRVRTEDSTTATTDDDGNGTSAVQGVAPKNRIFSRLVMSSLGKPLYHFQTFSQLLRAFADCIRGHRSLLDEKILHRDISLHNILLTRTLVPTPTRTSPRRSLRRSTHRSTPPPTLTCPPPTHSPSSGDHGFLIDLDYAVLLSREYRSEATHRTGTAPFMAIDILSGNINTTTGHTYRHDLESFLYVLLWLCTFYTKSPSTSSIAEPHCRISPRAAAKKSINAWVRGDWTTRAATKYGQMVAQPFFEVLLTQMDPVFKKAGDGGVFADLAREWRECIFGNANATGTASPDTVAAGEVTDGGDSSGGGGEDRPDNASGDRDDRSVLYRTMLGALDRAIDRVAEQ